MCLSSFAVTVAYSVTSVHLSVLSASHFIRTYAPGLAHDHRQIEQGLGYNQHPAWRRFIPGAIAHAHIQGCPRLVGHSDERLPGFPASIGKIALCTDLHPGYPTDALLLFGHDV